MEFSEDEDGSSGVSDNTDQVAPDASGTNGQVFDEFSGQGSASTTPDESDIAAMVAAATDGDDDAQKALGQIAIDAGVPEKDVDDAGSWEEVAELIEQARSSTSSEEPAEEVPEVAWEPKKGEVYSYKPLDPKTKRPGRKSVEVEVTAVDKKRKLCDLRNNDDKKLTYKAVAWESLESAS